MQRAKIRQGKIKTTESFRDVQQAKQSIYTAEALQCMEQCPGLTVDIALEPNGVIQITRTFRYKIAMQKFDQRRQDLVSGNAWYRIPVEALDS